MILELKAGLATLTDILRFKKNHPKVLKAFVFLFQNLLLLESKK